MTPTSHNKTLGILHLAYAGLMTLLMAAMSIFMLAMMSMETANNNGEPIPVGFLAFTAIVLVLVTLLHAIPSFLAGYALLKRKRWAKTMGLIAAIVAGLNFPLGSALCVFTLYFLFGESGRLLYPQAAYALPPGDASWAGTNSRELEREYVPPSAPPDWR
jgi:hypothetical protein